jgi:A/G-specific adenine glycosylase
MCQQTRVDTAIPYYEKFLARWPTLAALAAADEDEVLGAWAGLGYYARARSLLATARACVERHGGALPDGEPEIRALRGIGPYTAGAVLSIAFGRRLPAVDGNVVRVLSRVFRIDDADPKPAVERVAGDLVPADAPGDWNQALMELGARVCLPRAPRCEACPIAACCAARKAGVAETLPRRSAKRPSPEVPVAVAICRRGAKTLLVRRPAKGLLAGMWAPPTDEAPGSGLEGSGFDVGAELASWTHKFTHRTWRCTAYACKLAREIEGARWATREELDAVPTAFRPALG